MQDGNKSIQMRRLELSARGCAGEWKGRAGGAGEWAGAREVGCAGAEGERRVCMRAVALAPHTHKKGDEPARPLSAYVVHTRSGYSAPADSSSSSPVVGESGEVAGVSGVLVSGSGPREMVMVMVVPGMAEPVRLWLMTTPASTRLLYSYSRDTEKPASSSAPRALFSPSPTTLGMLTVPGPVETV